MSARLPLTIVGAIIMFVSLLFPTLYCYINDKFFGVEIQGSFFYWIYGNLFTWIEKEDALGNTYTTTYINFRPDILGLICMLIIIVGGILALVLGCATESKAAFIGGIFGIAGMIIFYVGVLMASPLTRLAELTEAGYFFIPFIGFFICIAGSILALVGGTLEKY
ncbi:MAG: hypothetical protein ACFFC9_08720 [Promethearchaeota archaeon]